LNVRRAELTADIDSAETEWLEKGAALEDAAEPG
jgi:hypothetical protein